MIDKRERESKIECQPIKQTFQLFAAWFRDVKLLQCKVDTGRADGGRVNAGRVGGGRVNAGRADSGRVDAGTADGGT